MPDFSKYISTGSKNQEVDPVKLFYSLPKKDRDVGDLWLPQGEALKQWHANRTKKDIVIDLDTGAGKTLIGMLIAQSIVNEGNKKVVYLCSNNQLVDQVKEKAEGYGLSVTTYKGSTKFSNYEYSRGESPLITSYHTLFNGRASFLHEDIDAIIFDDAHTAQNILRSQYTLSISNDNEFKGLYQKLSEIFLDYFKIVYRDSTYRDIVAGNDDTVIFIPTFVWSYFIDQVKEILYSGDIQEGNTGFAWEFLKDNLDLCCAYINSSEFQICPFLPPTKLLPYFSDKVRRIYLSATLNNKDEFYRTFGKIPECYISPQNSAGKCERMILTPKLSDQCEDSFKWVSSAIREFKTVIITPSKPKAKKWREATGNMGEIINSDNEITQELINEFKKEIKPVKLILTSRYDGIDFPKDTCNCLVVDDLPSGMNHSDKFLWRHLSLAEVLQSTVASRVMQALGRTTRGVNDYSAVLICGGELEKWLINYKNRHAISGFVCQQLGLGDEISKDLADIKSLRDAIKAITTRNESWQETYRHEIKIDQLGCTEMERNSLDDDLMQIAKAEKDFSYELWVRNYEKAASVLNSVLDKAFKSSTNLGHWLEHWLGFCHKMSGETELAARYFTLAGKGERQIGRYVDMDKKILDEGREISEQVRKILELIKCDGKIDQKAIAEFKTSTNNISSTVTANVFEQNIYELGRYLGYESSRPDKKYNTGPDALWIPADKQSLAILFEAKSEKKDGGVIYKRDVLQMGDHSNWVANNHNIHSVMKVLITDCSLMSDKANPDNDVYVIQIDQFVETRDKLLRIFEKLLTKDPADYERKLLHELEEAKLDWNRIFDSWIKIKAIDIAKIKN